MSNETRIASIAFFLFWLLLTVVVLMASRWSERVRRFRDEMMAQWKPALAIALLTLLSLGLSGRSLLNPFPVVIFCQVLIGVALAHRIAGYEPLPVSQSVVSRRNTVRALLFMAGTSLLLGAVGFLVGSVGIGIVRAMAHETYNADAAYQAMGIFPFTKAQAFFYFLSGAGIAEETTYRLILISLVWWLTRRKWLAVVLSAMVFAVYHLTPLSGGYLAFWQFPISQLVSTILIGLVWGYAFVKRGYETPVLAHTLSDWIPVLLFLE